MIHYVISCKIVQATIVRLSLVENKAALLRTSSEDLLVKFEEATMVETWVLVVYLKMTDNTRWKLADSFSEGMFQLSPTRLDSM